MAGNFKICKDPKLIISFLSILLFLSEYLCCFSLKSFNVIFLKRHKWFLCIWVQLQILNQE